MMRVVKITHDGTTLIEKDLDSALQALADGDDELYTIEFTQMLVREFDALPEFTGF